MSRAYVFILLAAAVFVLNACGNHAFDTTGYVLEKTSTHILIADRQLDLETNPQPVYLSEHGVKEAYSLTVNNEKILEGIEVGDKVKVKFDGPVAESFPAQAQIASIKKVNESDADDR